MNMYKKLERGIVVLKKKEEKWKLNYKNLVEEVMHLIEENSNKVKTVEFMLKDQEANIDSAFKNLEKKISENSAAVSSIVKKNQEIDSSFRNAINEVKDNTRETERFKSHVTEFVNELLSNYENRFGILKRDIDRALEKNMRILERMVYIRNDMKRKVGKPSRTRMKSIKKYRVKRK